MSPFKRESGYGAAKYMFYKRKIFLLALFTVFLTA